ncbi:MAG: hypothetical protein ACI837_002716 [Crocinitomicaceae bacterium]|jgi:hypothetical protein
MKLKPHAFANYLILILLSANFSYGQSPSIHTPPAQVSSTEYQFEIDYLTPSLRSAHFSHLWWFGDNGFSFNAIPSYAFQQWNGSTFNILSVPTENYGSGGPPPLALNGFNPTIGSAPNAKVVLAPGNSIYMQSYRNAVIGDTLYLIVSYANPDPLGIPNASGDLALQLPPTTALLPNFMANHAEMFPNGEAYNPSSISWSFSNLKSHERSILIPVKIMSGSEDELDFTITLTIEDGSTGEVIGTNYYPMSVPVAESHDPNLMIENSEAETQCDFGGEKINYTVNFQNVGEGATNYVQVISYLDPKIDMNSISDIKLPKEYGNITIQQYQQGNSPPHADAWYTIDKPNSTITFDFFGLRLLSPFSPMCTDLELTRSDVKFSVRMKPDYVFGDPVIAYSSIVFDSNDAITTDSIFTTCGDPLPMGKGGGFYNQDPTTAVSIADNLWIYILIGVGAILLVTLIVRRFRRR